MTVSRTYLIIDPKNSFLMHKGPDRLLLEPEDTRSTFGIEQIRKLKNWAKFKPFTKKVKYAFIPMAQRLTHQAQNAILKLLEEPPSRTIFLLSVDDPQNLLPTIASRCLIFSSDQLKKNFKNFPHFKVLKYQPNLSRNQSFISFEEINKRPLEEKFKYSKQVSAKNKEELVNMLNSWILELRKSLLSYKVQVKKTYLISLINKIASAKKAVEKNVNKRLALENLFLQLE